MDLNSFLEDYKSYDSLTQVYTRDVIVGYINFLIAENVPFTLAIIDIDNFKYVNDTYGHLSGDKILIEVAARIKEVTDGKGTVGRYGGDEFLVVYPELIAYDEVWKNCRKIMQIMNGWEISEFPGLYVTVTVGVSRFPKDSTSYEGVLEVADKALYRGKTKGRNCFIIYLPEKHANIQLKTEKDRTLSSMYLHTVVFRALTKIDDLRVGIKVVFDFLSSYYMIDHLCLQNGDKVYFEKIHSLSKTKTFTALDLDLVAGNLGASTDFFYVNQMEALVASGQAELAGQYDKQGIKAAFCCKITEDDDGKMLALRAESTSRRIWQHGEMDIYITVAKVIGILYSYGKIKL